MFFPLSSATCPWVFLQLRLTIASGANIGILLSGGRELTMGNWLLKGSGVLRLPGVVLSLSVASVGLFGKFLMFINVSSGNRAVTVSGSVKFFSLDKPLMNDYCWL